MIASIKEDIYTYSNCPEDEIDDLAERLLKNIEENGMSPPTYEEDCCPKEFKGTKLEGAYTAFIPEWENED